MNNLTKCCPINVGLTKNDYDLICDLAKKNNMNLSQFVREVVFEPYFKKVRKNERNSIRNRL